jgi:hypothetical protein
MVALSKALRKQFPKTDDPRTSFLLSHAPQSPYLQSQYGVDQFYGSYLSILAQLPAGTIDFLNIQFYNNAASQGPTADAAISNALTQPTVLPAGFGPTNNVLVAPALPQESIAIGQLAGDSTQPTIAPFCRLGEPGCKWSLMYWLQDQSDVGLADADVDRWYEPIRCGPRSPPTRVVYYMNGALSVPEGVQYSRANVLIIGFAYPVSTKPDTIANPDPSLPRWASFGFFYAGGFLGAPYGLVNAPAYKAWRDVEPGKRKLMIGIGGAAATPPYATWNAGENSTIVAAGLARFKAAFAGANAFEIDGFDMDYEDSNALNPTIPQIPTPTSALYTDLAETQVVSFGPARVQNHCHNTRVLIPHKPAAVAGLAIWGVVTLLLIVVFILFCIRMAKKTK